MLWPRLCDLAAITECTALSCCMRAADACARGCRGGGGAQLHNTHHAAAKVQEAAEGALKDLQLAYLDLFLVHWPVTGNKGAAVEPPIKETWQVRGGVDVTSQHYRACEETATLCNQAQNSVVPHSAVRTVLHAHCCLPCCLSQTGCRAAKFGACLGRQWRTWSTRAW